MKIPKKITTRNIPDERLRKLANELLSKNYRIYTTFYSSVSRIDNISYFTVVKDNKLASVSKESYGMRMSVASVHKPNTNSGTGYRVTDEWTYEISIEDVDRGLNTVKPPWAGREPAPMKYKNFTEWKNKQSGHVIKIVRG